VSSRSPIESARPLGMALSLSAGGIGLQLAGFTLAPGLELARLELAVPVGEAVWPLTPGALKHAASRLVGLELEIRLESIADWLLPHLARNGSPIRALQLAEEQGGLLLCAAVDPGAWLAAQLSITAIGGEIELALGEPLSFGAVVGGAPRRVVQAAAEGFASLWGAGEPRSVGRTALRVAPLDPVLFRALAARGWRLPRRGGTELRVALSNGALWIRGGGSSAEPAGPGPQTGRRPIDRLSARLGPGREDDPLERLDPESPLPLSEFSAWMRRIEGDPPLVDRFLLLASGFPELGPTVARQVEARLPARPRSVRLLLARVAIADSAGRREVAATGLEQVAEVLGAEGRRVEAECALRVARNRRSPARRPPRDPVGAAEPALAAPSPWQRGRAAAVVRALEAPAGPAERNRAFRVGRALLRRRPLDAPLLAALSAALPPERHSERAVLEAVRGAMGERERCLLPPLGNPSAAQLFAVIAPPALSTPLAALLQAGAAAVASLLPPPAPPRAPRFPAGELEPLAASLGRLLGADFELVLELGSAPVELEAGEPPAIVLSAAAAEDPDPARVPFVLARAALLLRLGRLIPLRWATLLSKVADADAEAHLEPPLHAAIGPLRERLRPSGLAAIEPLGEQADVSAQAFRAWATAADTAADRFGLLVARDLASAAKILASERSDASQPAADPLKDLAYFLVSADLSALYEGT
jgi:hypothetical protein